MGQNLKLHYAKTVTLPFPKTVRRILTVSAKDSGDQTRRLYNGCTMRRCVAIDADKLRGYGRATEEEHKPE